MPSWSSPANTESGICILTEKSLGRCMRKCFRYAGCVAFNFYETGNFDICELFSKIVPTRENITGHKVTRGFFSDTCGDIEDFTDYRFVTQFDNRCHRHNIRLSPMHVINYF